MNITIVGLGLIGGSMAKDLKRTAFASKLTGVESSKEHAEEALKLNLVDEICPLEKALIGSDMIILAIPVDSIKKQLPLILDQIADHTTVIDLGSTKSMIANTVKDHPKRKNYIAAHPMSGTENSGPSAALDQLFTGKLTIICDQQLSGPQHLALTEKMFQTIGMEIAYMSSDEQDHSTAFISHLPHAIAFALANAVQDKEKRSIIFDLASGGFRSTVRLAKSAPSMWGPIFRQNKKYVVESLEVYIKHLNQLKDSIEHEDGKLDQLMTNANQIRGILDGTQSSLIKNEKKIVKFYTK